MTAFTPPDRRTQQIPVFRFDEKKASLAYAAHVALLDQEKRFPELRNNPAWKMLRADAYEAFVMAFEGMA